MSHYQKIIHQGIGEQCWILIFVIKIFKSSLTESKDLGMSELAGSAAFQANVKFQGHLPVQPSWPK